MSAVSCADAASLVDELALDTLPGDLRAQVLVHLSECTSCRTMVDQLSATADALLFAAPIVEPSPGFDLRVRTAIQGRRRRRWPRLVGLAAAAAAVVAISGGGVLVAESGRRHSVNPAAGVLAGKDRDLLTAKLIAADGRQVGEVSIYSGSPAWFFMRVERGQLTTTYRCVLDLSGGRSITLGDLSVAAGKGAWGQHIDLRGQTVRAARVVDEDGQTEATATFA